MLLAVVRGERSLSACGDVAEEGRDEGSAGRKRVPRRPDKEPDGGQNRVR